MYGFEDAVYQNALHAFTEIADTYDARMAGSPLHLLESTEVLTALPGLVDTVVADFGCGTGRYALQLACLGARRVVGVDLAPAMLEVARRKARRAEDSDELPLQWVEADLTERLPLDSELFDLGVCALTLSFLSEAASALGEMARTLKPGGTLLFSDYHPHGLLAAQAAAVSAGRRDTLPFLRFTSAAGEECRLRQYIHRVSDLFAASRDAGLILDHIAEPVADRRLAYTYQTIRDQVGIPLALVMRFHKPHRA